MNRQNEHNVILLNLKALKYHAVYNSNIYIKNYNRYDIITDKKEVWFYKKSSTSNEYRLFCKYSFKDFIIYTNKLIEGENNIDNEKYKF